MKRKYRNITFLVELVVNILVFSISCAILVGLFGKAGQISKRSRQEAFASAEVLSVIETIKVRGAGALEHTQWQDDESFVRHYDTDWNPTDDENAPYHIYMKVTEEPTGAGVLNAIEATASTSSGEELYSVSTASYAPNGEAGGPQ